MNKLDKYDATSERLDNASIGERLEKFTKISELLGEENIDLVSVSGYGIKLEDKTCGFKLTHGITSWEIYRIVDVVDMIVVMRNDYIKRMQDDSNV